VRPAGGARGVRCRRVNRGLCRCLLWCGAGRVRCVCLGLAWVVCLIDQLACGGRCRGLLRLGRWHDLLLWCGVVLPLVVCLSWGQPGWFVMAAVLVRLPGQGRPGRQGDGFGRSQVPRRRPGCGGGRLEVRRGWASRPPRSATARAAPCGPGPPGPAACTTRVRHEGARSERLRGKEAD
jgi:hypothetical protein